jgi:hypothetical protein
LSGDAARERFVCALGGAEKQVQTLKREMDRLILLLEHAAETLMRT